MRRALVCGAGGFIGSHLVKRLKREGFWVRGVDLKYPRFAESEADDFIIGDLREMQVCQEAVDCRFDEVYQLAADMGGAGYIFTGENDADVMHNSAQINLNMLEACRRRNSRRIFYSSSACIYPEHIQRDANHPGLAEDDAYPAAPDSEYGWEKLFSERLYQSLCAQSRLHRPHSAISQYLRTRGRVERRTREVTGGALPQGRRGERGRRGGDMGRWRADAVVPLYR